MTAGNQPLSSGSAGPSSPGSAGAPSAWQYRESIGSDWGEWFCLNIPIEKFKEDEKHAFEDGLYEIRPLYAEPQPAGVAQGVLDRGDVARIICCGSTGCQFVGDSEDGSKCYCDTSDFHGSGVERKTGAILALSVVTPSPGAGEPREKEITRLATIEECADIVEGQIVHHNCREWPAVSSQGNRASDDPIVQHCDKLAAAIRTLALTSAQSGGAAK